MRSPRPALAAAAFAAAALLAPSAHAVLLAPTPYLSEFDSPFATTFSAAAFANGDYTYFALEDFEDGVFDVPGATPIGGSVSSPGPATDSVDLDDGVINGSGSGGSSGYSAGSNTLAVVFDPLVLGGLPTHAGIVWTDVGATDGSVPYGTGQVVFEAFDGNGASLGTTIAVLGDGAITGGTLEDRFFGAINLGNGISRITISMPNSTDWEVDHLQYGRVVVIPEPSSALLVGLGLIGLGLATGTRRPSRHRTP